MKKYFVLFLVGLMVPAFGAGRSFLGNDPVANRATIGPKQTLHTGVTVSAGAAKSEPTTSVSLTQVDKIAVVTDDVRAIDTSKLDKERLACISNNIGVNNTFVWAAKGSDVSNYSTMVEDVNNPENNVCFVLVGMRSDDERISVSDIQPRYFKWGDNITCGSWVDENKMEQRILDAKKKARVWGTVAASVGGAGVGVGAMELFGNKLIGKSVMGENQYEKYSVDWYNMKYNQLGNDVKQNVKNLADGLKQKCEESSSDSKCKEPRYANLIEWYKQYGGQ